MCVCSPGKGAAVTVSGDPALKGVDGGKDTHGRRCRTG